jgi:Fur family zinc uptake transcriptional regulator
MAIDKVKLTEKISSAGKTVTPQRIAIFRTLEVVGEAITAYELRDLTNSRFDESFNISTIYRVLDFWVALGLVHKIESANKFVVCKDEHRDHIHVLQHCTSCQKIEERCEISRLMKMPLSSTFKAHKNQVIEIQGQCGNCLNFLTNLKP